jgi:hypothetical protein
VKLRKEPPSLTFCFEYTATFFIDATSPISETVAPKAFGYCSVITVGIPRICELRKVQLYSKIEVHADLSKCYLSSISLPVSMTIGIQCITSLKRSWISQTKKKQFDAVKRLDDDRVNAIIKIVEFLRI